MTDRGSRTTSRVVLIGLDGATFRVIDALIAEGKLPHIASLIERGARSPLLSTIPILSWPAWPAMMTGTYPGKHGVYYHFHRHGYRERVITSHDVRTRAIWNIAGEHGLRVAVVRVPVTYPPTKVNGVMVSGGPMPKGLHTYPAEMAADMARAVPGYPMEGYWSRVLGRRGLKGLAHRVEQSFERSLRAALYLWRREAWDVFLCVFGELDPLQHFAPWPEDMSAPDAAQRQAVVARCYEKADMVVGKLLAAAGADATVALVSDHGFGEGCRFFYLNRWLAAGGWLTSAPGPQKRLRLIRRDLCDVLGMLGLHSGRLAAALPVWIPRFVAAPPQEAIDWSRTRAFGARSCLDGIRINLRGREPRGIVEPGTQYEELRQTLIAALGQVRDPDTGQPAIAWARRREQVFHGPQVEAAPDVIYMSADNMYWESGSLHGTKIIGPDPVGHKGSHRREGILVLAGPAVRRGVTLERYHIVDVAPTLLHLLGLPVSKDSDGQVLLAALDQDYLGQRAVEFCEPVAAGVEDAAGESAREQQEMEEHLRGLGYISD